MTTIITGHSLGLQDGSFSPAQAQRPDGRGHDRPRRRDFVNVANGNLVLQEVDAFLPSQAEDFRLVRTYNSRGALPAAPTAGSCRPAVTLASHQDTLATATGAQTSYLVTYGDGSTTRVRLSDADERHLHLDRRRRRLRDAQGAEQARRQRRAVHRDARRPEPVKFDKSFLLVSSVDTNGVRMDYVYQAGRLQQVKDDTGHVVTYNYSGLGKLASISETYVEAGQTKIVALATYTYADSKLVAVTDRAGHTTSYHNDAKACSTASRCPPTPTRPARTIAFAYQQIKWDDHPHFITDFDKGNAWVLTSVTDAMGVVTTFDYQLQLSARHGRRADDRDKFYKVGGGRYFTGGTTRVTDALGKVVAYSYDADGYLTKVVDAEGFQTTYTYSNNALLDKDNLRPSSTATPRPTTSSIRAYYRALRKELGFVYQAGDTLPAGKVVGDGKLVANLTQAEKDAILARFTTRYTYDARGNLLSVTDGAGNLTTLHVHELQQGRDDDGARWATRSSTSRRARSTRPSASSSASPAPSPVAQPLRSKTALRALYTTSYAYDAKQNLTTRTDPGGDVTQFALRRLRQPHAAHRRLPRRGRRRGPGEEPGDEVRVRRASATTSASPMPRAADHDAGPSTTSATC